MGLVNKVQHTLNCVNDITNALKFHNITMNNIPLKEYGNIIRNFLVNQKISKNIILYSSNIPNVINKNKISIKTLLIYGNNNNYILSHKIFSCLNKKVITYDKKLIYGNNNNYILSHKLSLCLNKNMIIHNKKLQTIQTNYLVDIAIPIVIEE